MSDSTPINDLDRAVMAIARSKSALPELMGRLGEGELWFLMPYHPEVEGAVLELNNGMRMPFKQLEDEEGPVVPIFSSFERAREFVKKGRVPARTVSLGSLPAKQVLEILGRAELRAVLNKNCRTGEMTLPPDMLRDIADGSALRPHTLGAHPVEETLTILDPSDYPTDLVQPVFEILRRHRNFRAVWIFERGKGGPLPSGGRRYQFLVLMEPRDEAIFHEFNLVVSAAKAPADEVQLGPLDESALAYIASLWQFAPAFYTAPDYERPPGAKE